MTVVERGLAALAPVAFAAIVAGWESDGTGTTVSLILVYCGSTVLAIILAEFKLLNFLPSLQKVQQGIVLGAVGQLHTEGSRFRTSQSSPEITRLISRAAWSLDNFCNIALFNMFPSLVQFVIALVILAFLQNVIVSIILVGTMAVYLLYTTRSVRTQALLYGDRLAHDGAVFADIGDSFLNHETVRSFDGFREEERRLSHSYCVALKAWRAQQWHLSTSKSLQSLIIQLGLFLILLFLYLDSTRTQITVSDLVMVNMFVIQIFLPLQSVGLLLASVAQALMDIDNLNQELNHGAPPAAAPTIVELPENDGILSVTYCDFRSEDSRPLVSGAFQIPLGRTTLVVGTSGSGKSSLLRGLAGALGDQSCTMQTNDRAVPPAGIARNVLYVAQTAGLFNQTLQYNISYPRTDQSADDLRSVIEAAALNSVIDGKAHGLNTLVGERGHNLSGGEQQRVAIARALNTPRAIMLFDEVTSGLDAVTEAKVLNNIRATLRGKTLVFSSHRVELFRHADHFIYVEGGRVLGAGRHEDLLSAHPCYSEIWRKRQSEGSGR